MKPRTHTTKNIQLCLISDLTDSSDAMVDFCLSTNFLFVAYKSEQNKYGSYLDDQ